MEISKVILITLTAFCMPYIIHFFFDVPMGFDEMEGKKQELENTMNKQEN